MCACACVHVCVRVRMRVYVCACMCVCVPYVNQLQAVCNQLQLHIACWWPTFCILLLVAAGGTCKTAAAPIYVHTWTNALIARRKPHTWV